MISTALHCSEVDCSRVRSNLSLSIVFPVYLVSNCRSVQWNLITRSSSGQLQSYLIIGALTSQYHCQAADLLGTFLLCHAKSCHYNDINFCNCDIDELYSLRPLGQTTDWGWGYCLGWQWGLLSGLFYIFLNLKTNKQSFRPAAQGQGGEVIYYRISSNIEYCRKLMNNRMDTFKPLYLGNIFDLSENLLSLFSLQEFQS